MPKTPTTDRTGAAARSPATTRRRALQQGLDWTLGGITGRAAWAGLGLAAVWPTQGTAQTPAAAPLPAELQSSLPAAQALGSTRLRFLGLEIYRARLWVLAGFNASDYAQSPFALELNYARALSGRLIAERSLKEMRRQSKPDAQQEAAWLAAMVQAFPDVTAGDRITGLHTPGQGARFWFNGQPRPAVRDTEFSRLFFGIWLSDASSEPALRTELLGQKS